LSPGDSMTSRPPFYDVCQASEASAISFLLHFVSGTGVEVLGHLSVRRWRPTTFYPLGLLTQLNPACALRSGDLVKQAPSTMVGCYRQPGWTTGLQTPRYV